MEDRTWIVTKHDTGQQHIGAANTVFTISNGYMALKGNLAEEFDGAHPATFINGVFDLADMVAFIRPTKYERRYLDEEYFDTATPSPSIANLPNPLYVRVFVDGREIDFRRGSVSGFAQTYDLRTGVYTYQYDYEAPDGKRTRVRMERACDMVNFHRAVMRYSVAPLNHVSSITLRSGIDGGVRSNLQHDRQFEVLDATCGDRGRCLLQARTKAREIEVRLAIADVLRPEADAECVIEHDAVYRSYHDLLASEQKPVVLERHIVMASSDDGRHGVECDVEAELDALAAAGWEGTVQANRAWWRHAWERADVRIEGDDLAQLYIRFCLFHLMSAAPRHTDKLSVPCKLLTGEHYQGTTFYDTDIYTEAFYTYVFPDVARSCLNYRYLGLEPGREIARDLGYAGAKFAWQAGPYGEEALGKWWRFTHTNIHIDGDVAYSLMRYWHASGDDEFLVERGIDILVESARFYTSRATWDTDNNRYDLSDVAGPDEGHCESRNNFYTNLLASRTLRWAREMLDFIRVNYAVRYGQVVERLSLDETEPERWRTVGDGLTFYFDRNTKVYEQCEGFYQLAPAPADLLEGRTAWFVTVFPYQALNQPDVVMGIVLLPDEFPEDVKRANWEFYRDKSMNFSSMSFVINSMMAKDVGDLDYAYRQFLISAGEDLDENLTGRRDTSDGIHGTASGGAWMAAVLGFGGVRVTKDGLSVDPRLPEHWKSLQFKLMLRGEVVSFAIDHSRVRILVGTQSGLELPARVCGRSLTLVSGQRVEIPTAG